MKLWLASILLLGLALSSMAATTAPAEPEQGGAEPEGTSEPAAEGEPEGGAAPEGGAEPEATGEPKDDDSDSGAATAILSFVSLASGVAFALVL